MTERPWAGRRLHFVGIGGAGMSGWARVAAQLGAEVSGSDRAESPALARLRSAGIDARAGHEAANVPDGAEVVLSTAVPADNPERIVSLDRGLRVMPRAELLGELTALKRVIAVAGAHGKTTTTSMAAHVLLGAGLEPGYLIGGELRTTGLNAAWGSGDWLVVEADESDRSMLSLDVDVAVLTNVELDHHATFGSLAELEADYGAFLAGAPEAIVWDRPELLALRGDEAPVIAYEARDVDLHDGGSRFAWRGHAVELAVPGIHNARNAVAALEAAALAGADPAIAAGTLAGFLGAGRRFERLGTTPSGAVVIDDYAHHPTEVAATIDAARTLDGAGRVWAVFQPHLFSRTQRLAREFGTALARADAVAVLDIYPARERGEDFPGVDGRLLAETTADAAGGRPVYWLPSFADAQRVLGPRLGARDVVLVLGAGDLDRPGRALVEGWADEHRLVDEPHAEALVHARGDLAGQRDELACGAVAAVGQRERVLGGDGDALGVAVAAREPGPLDEPRRARLDAAVRLRPAGRLGLGALGQRGELLGGDDRVGEERAGRHRIGVGWVDDHALAPAQGEDGLAHVGERRGL